MMKKTRVLMVGAGSWANEVFYPSLAEIEEIEVAAICTRTERRLHKTADRYGVKGRYTDLEKMLTSEEADAAYVIMSPHLVFDPTIAVLRHKLPVFIEKPPALTAFQVRSFAREAEKNGVFCMVGFNRRYIPLVNDALRWVAAEGPLTQVMCQYMKHRSPVYIDGAIDAIGCDAIHAVDTVRYLAGSDADVEEVHAVVGRYEGEEDNAWNAVLRFSNGVTGAILTNWCMGNRVFFMEIHAPGRSVFIDAREESVTGVRLRDGKEEPFPLEGDAARKEFHAFYGHLDQNRHFIDCVRNGTPCRSTVQDAVKTMELVEALRKGRCARSL
ncbi:MAG: Gfo/Idh/MocA family oxidoreductase [Planctomycetota bacterium]